MDTGVYYIGKVIYVILCIAFCMAFHLALYNISWFCKYVFVKCLKQAIHQLEFLSYMIPYMYTMKAKQLINNYTPSCIYLQIISLSCIVIVFHRKNSNID